ncbi:hypothetical protein [Peribacillus frigoritolerans]|uniref:hypothetical protein n=1 Tax=Peribacillus frigoritolerans TaxID=450367 RepID=UPI0023DA7B8C|nr:hypothetical protein [Peribacillus frigoritolerans]MDF1999478.1 hypothetical protein [Peribacillus frigoritolerans]
MKKKIKIMNDNLNTDLYALLKNLPDNILYHQEHGLRHPLGIYNISFKRVTSGFKGVFNSANTREDFSDKKKGINEDIKKLQGKLPSLENEEKQFVEKRIEELKGQLKQISQQQATEDKKTLDSVKELLDSLMSFIDDTYHILKCFFPANSVTKDIRFADKWMEKVEKRLIIDYKNKLKEYRDILAPIVNKIKHNHARLNRISLKTELGQIEGYYVEGVDSKGSLGPDREIHKQFRNQETAFSLNRDLKFHLVNFYFICHHLKVLINRIIKDKHNLQIDTNNVTFKNSEENFDIIKMVNALPNLFFPDEINKSQPEILIKENEVEVIFPSKTSLLLYTDIEINFVATGDGVSKSFRLPYWISR